MRIHQFENIKKPWGSECLIDKNDKYAFKKIFLKTGTRTSLQSHHQKLETIYIVTGEIELETYSKDDNKKVEIYKKDEAYTIVPGCKHRVNVIKDCTLFEVSTPELDDVIRYEDDYGRES